MQTSFTLQADFDQIALLSGDGWDHNAHYHQYLLRHVPAHCEAALDVGCGLGTFSRLLARRAGHVVALDLSPRLIALAQERSRQYPSIQYQVWDTPDVLTLEPLLNVLRLALEWVGNGGE